MKIKEALYYSDELGILIVSLSRSGRIFLQDHPTWTGFSVKKEKALNHILKYQYQLIGYL